MFKSKRFYLLGHSRRLTRTLNMHQGMPTTINVLLDALNFDEAKEAMARYHEQEAALWRETNENEWLHGTKD